MLNILFYLPLFKVFYVFPGARIFLNTNLEKKVYMSRGHTDMQEVHIKCTNRVKTKIIFATGKIFFYLKVTVYTYPLTCFLYRKVINQLLFDENILQKFCLIFSAVLTYMMQLCSILESYYDI